MGGTGGGNRPARRIFALTHSALPNEAVTFVEVALVKEPSASIQVPLLPRLAFALVWFCTRPTKVSGEEGGGMA